MQLERIKLLITKTQLLYQEAALAEIGYQPTYFSQFNPKLYVLKANIKEYKEEDIVKPGQKVISVNDEVFDDLFKKILASLHTENIFVGLNNTLLSDFSFMMGKDFEVDILPKVNIIKANNNYKVVFKKTGEYMLRFYDLRKGKKVLFEKKIMVNPIPDPIVKVRGDNLSNYSISVKDLLSAERLEAKLEINNLNFFPGRINSYKVIRIHNGKEEESVNNYGVSDESATYLIENNKSFKVGLSREGNKKIAWVGFDQFGIRLECIAIVFIDSLYVMHLKPIDAKEDINEITKRLW